MKVIEKIQEAAANGRTAFSFEYFPPKTEEGVENLFERMDRMVAHGPNFCDITWGAGGSTADVTLDIANRMQNMVCVETMMHLTCTNMPVEKIDSALDAIKSNGIQNVLALRGDPPHGQDKFVQVAGGFSCALDLVQHIRAKYGDYFGITVAGYPEAHPEVILGEEGATEEAYSNDLAYLKRKVDAGADLIVTQLFYDTDMFLKFVNDCRQIGITCPIVPGIMPINNYKGFIRMTGFCKTKIPAEITAALEPIKDNEEAVKAYGIHLGTEMCKKILATGINTLHLYTLNMEKTALAILMNLGLIEESKLSRTLPWRPPTNVFRVKEDVRPIFWANRPKSYISRTIGWDQYPHGRWGDSRNPSYGALTDYQFTRPRGRGKKLQEEWAVPVKSVQDINERFMNFCQGKLTSSPWSELDGLQPETKIIDDQLVKINLKGFLTINSQPAVNAEKSDSPSVGWGGPGGYVYQKAYVEFFCAKEKLDQLIEKSKAFPSLTYIAVNKEGETFSNIPANAVNAVTWGVFPGKEIIQPTVVDSASFLVWKDEAFEIWSKGWACLFPEGDSSRELLEQKARKPSFELTKPSTGQELQQDTTPHTHTTAGQIHGYIQNELQHCTTSEDKLAGVQTAAVRHQGHRPEARRGTARSRIVVLIPRRTARTPSTRSTNLFSCRRGPLPSRLVRRRRTIGHERGSPESRRGVGLRTRRHPGETTLTRITPYRPHCRALGRPPTTRNPPGAPAEDGADCRRRTHTG